MPLIMDGPTALPHQPMRGRGDSWITRRDRVLLVLHDRAGLSHPEISRLTTEQVIVGNATATIITPTRTVTLTADPDAARCGPCTLARWLRTLNMTVVYADQRVPTAVITRSAPPAAGSPHPCMHTTDTSPALRRQPLLPAIDQWGPIPPPRAGAPASRARSTRATHDRTLIGAAS